ncbi:18116_t:CDS:2 [Funneliformis geosporum]|uniref:1403_t:CDS:1 n=1 Tax=Funneliformis geosporum TaxID=1117311 RepID=A0A9W4T007_9GLOM|nr:1403_t:CDS:2 [Funneliformis geosporum]CAI2189337.1 18116_t:CDS:2 [Funneliformis geosporum]
MTHINLVQEEVVFSEEDWLRIPDDLSCALCDNIDHVTINLQKLRLLQLTLSTPADNTTDLFTRTELSELNPEEIMTIENIAVSQSYFQTFIISKLGEGLNLFNISLSAEMKNGEIATVQLTRLI